MNNRLLEAFTVLADELHFGRAAARLHISQSALSQQLQKLESDLGAQLVIRTSREISLTEAGELFLEPALETLAAAERAVLVVRDYNEGRTGRISIGSLGAGLNGPLPNIIRAFRRVSPTSTIELTHAGDSASQERAVLAGKLDAAVVRRVANDRSIISMKLLDESFVVFLPSNHRLAARAQLSLAELADESFVFWPRRLGPSFYDLVVDGCRAKGFEPRVEALGDTLEAQLALVTAEVGVSIQASSNASIHRAGTTAVPLHPDDLAATLWFAYRRWHHSAVVDKFLTVVDELNQ
jgi:DNA-binding transcriptional LysR family regulator